MRTRKVCSFAIHKATAAHTSGWHFLCMGDAHNTHPKFQAVLMPCTIRWSCGLRKHQQVCTNQGIRRGGHQLLKGGGWGVGWHMGVSMRQEGYIGWWVGCFQHHGEMLRKGVCMMPKLQRDTVWRYLWSVCELRELLLLPLSSRTFWVQNYLGDIHIQGSIDLTTAVLIFAPTIHLMILVCSHMHIPCPSAFLPVKHPAESFAAYQLHDTVTTTLCTFFFGVTQKT